MQFDQDKMAATKTGYAREGGIFTKIDWTGKGRRIQHDYLTFCFKMYATEKSLDTDDAKGTLDRSFIIKYSVAIPQYNIKKIFGQDNNPKHIKLRHELEKTRKLLVAYRLLHFDDVIKDVKLNIYNLEAELTEPQIRLFRNSPQALKEILPALNKLLEEKREVKSYSLEAKIYRALSNLMEEENKIENYNPESLDCDTIGISNELLREKLLELTAATFCNPPPCYCFSIKS